MPSASLKRNESFEKLMRRFKRAAEKDDVLGELRKRELYEKPTAARKRAKAAAKKRWERKQSEMNIAGAKKRLY